MIVVWVAQEHLMAHWCQAMASFWPRSCVKIGTLMPNLGKNSHNFKV
jgi:hypothetical protein